MHLFQNNIYAASVRYPVSYERYNENVWPAFLVDIMPSGAARKYWLRQLQLKNGPIADFELLEKGAINPPGNIRVKTDTQFVCDHQGFAYEEIINRGIHFTEYAENSGAMVFGTSGAQGESPKFLLENQHLDADTAMLFFKDVMEKLDNLKIIMKKNNIDMSTISIVTARYDIFMSELRGLSIKSETFH